MSLFYVQSPPDITTGYYYDKLFHPNDVINDTILSISELASIGVLYSMILYCTLNCESSSSELVG